MSGYRVNWQGSFPAIVTPFDKDGAINDKLLRENVRMTLGEGAHGIVAAGHFGEAHLMNEAEREHVISVIVEEVNGRVPVVAGTGGISTVEVIRQTKAAKAAGANGAMIEGPYFMLTKPADTVAHYARITDAVDFPIKVYNNPRRGVSDITVDQLVKIAENANIGSIKDSKGDFERVMNEIQAVGDKVRIFIGPSRIFGFNAVIMGAHGFVDGLSQVCGRPAIELYDAARARDFSRGVELQHYCFRVGQLIYDTAGTAPATIKDAMRLMGKPGGWSRPPLCAMEGADLAFLEKGLRKLNLLREAAAE
ncbi:MAG: dihydrodipicolinate synthase family protein [Proteobacteria bacterium]|nr:dihydrodipicolinate synthase family protein [Pseudomonadota bacterium]